MTIDIQILTVLSAAEIEALPDFEAVRRRFTSSFAPFVLLEKTRAVQALLQEEFPGKRVASNPAFIAEVLRRLPDEAVTEKRYIFLSINPAFKR